MQKHVKDWLIEPNLRIGSPQYLSRNNTAPKAFFALEGDDVLESLDGEHTGFWVEDEETGEVGLLEEFDDVFWAWDDTYLTFRKRRFKGRSVRRHGKRRFPKNKGKSDKARKHFRKKSNKRHTAHVVEETETIAAASSGQQVSEENTWYCWSGGSWYDANGDECFFGDETNDHDQDQEEGTEPTAEDSCNYGKGRGKGKKKRPKSKNTKEAITQAKHK